jgi:hypothetical protein
MSKLKELEKRLRDEPENLGLRVMLAGALHDAGRLGDAVELYRSVAIAYREQGRIQQAITVCRNVLEIAPDDASCQALLATMLGRPPQISPPADLTPLPPPLPYHVADPTLTSQPQRLMRSDLPPSLARELDAYPDISGIAHAARQISEALIAAARQREADDSDDALIDALVDELGDDDDSGLDTRPIPRISTPPPLPPVGQAGDDDPTTLLAARPAPRAATGDDDVTLPPAIARPRPGTLEDEKTAPRIRPRPRR